MLLRKLSQTFRVAAALIFATFSSGLLVPATTVNAMYNGGNEGDCSTGLILLEKYEWDKDSSTYALDSPDSDGTTVSIAGNATAGTFSVIDSDYTVSEVRVKGGQNQDVDTYTPPVTSGSFNNSALVKSNGNLQDISNVQFCGTVTPPHDECPLLSGNQPVGTSCTAPANDRETRDLDGVVNCQEDTYTIVHEERTRDYSWDGDSWEANAWSAWTTYNTTVTEATDEQCPPHDECPLLSGNQPLGTSCTAPADDRETRDLDGVVNCEEDTYIIVHQERTRDYTWDGDSWEAGAWSDWTTYDTTVTDATNKQCPKEEEPKKVFVCKFVGTPGIDERLQTGQNPISVSVNAIPNFQGIGSYFADAHGRSLVLAFDEGQAEPDVSACVTDVCPLIPGVQTDTTLCPPGQGGGGQTQGTSTTTPQVLSTSTELPATLPATGGANNPLMIVLAGILAYGAAYFLQGRRQLARE